MSYPGDSSLSSEIRERIATTFAQTIDLAEAGKNAEALLGCDFILSLDPLFEPARELQEQVRDSSGEVDVAGFRSRLPALSTSAQDLTGHEAGKEADTAHGLIEDTAQTAQSPLEDDASADRIAKLLAEGDLALGEGHFQQAIDSWSRIFLIDLDHPEASGRIAEAQRLKAEREREIEEILNEGLSFLDRGLRDEAAAAFRRVLQLAPDHLSALEHLADLDSPETENDAAPVEPSDGGGDLDDEGAMFDTSALFEGPDAPPTAKLDPPLPEVPPDFAEPPTPIVRSTPSSQGRLVLVGGLVLLLAFGVSAVLWMNWSTFFPNSEEAPVARPRGRADRIARITGLYDSGSPDEAIAALREIAPAAPDYARAQELLALWSSAAIESAAESAANAASAAVTVEAQRTEMLETARLIYDAGEYLPAARLFARAAAVAPLSGTEADLFDDAKRQLEPIADLVDLYSQREYDLLLPKLWRFFEDHPTNRDARRLLVDSHYNLAVRRLKRRQPRPAVALIREAVKLAPEDPFVKRIELFAASYERASRDLLFDIFVDNLEFRP